MPVKFADVAKTANDLLDRGFDTNNSVKVTSKAANGVTYNAEVKSKGSDKVAGKVGFKYKHSSGVNFKKFELANNGKLTADVLLEGAVDNATFTLGVVMEPAKALSGVGEKCEVGVEYTHDKAFFTLAVSPVMPTAADASLVLKLHDNVCATGQYKGKLDDSWVTTAGNAGLAFCDGATKVSVTSADFFQKFNLAFSRKHSGDINLAAKVGLDRANPSAASLTVGGSYKIDGDTSAKGKVDLPTSSLDGATASLGFSHKLNGNVKLSAGSKINLNPQDDFFGATFGVGLEFGSV